MDTAPRPTGDLVVEMRGITVRFGGRTVLDRVDLHVPRGEVYVLMGPSGCGKTTLLKCLVGLLVPTEGTVAFEGKPLSGMDAAGFDDFRRATGMVFQGGALLNSISLRENVALPLRAHTDQPPEVVDEAVRMRLAQVGLLDAADRMPSELSGGMRKRAGIARALALDPRLVVFDEPTSGLDPITADGIDDLLLSLSEATGATMVVVTHDLPSARKIAHRMAVMSGGRALVEGDWNAIEASADPRVRDFLDRRAPRVEPHPSALVAETGGPR